MDQKFYTINDMAGILGLTVSAIHGHLNRRNYHAVPIPVRLGRRLAWPVQLVDEWIRAKIEQAQESVYKSTEHRETARRGRPLKRRTGY